MERIGEKEEEDYPKPPITSQTRQRPIVEVCPLELFGFFAEEILECEPGSN